MLRVVALFLGLFALSSIPALSETYYVAPLGTVVAGTPDGTTGKPFLSVDLAFKSGKVKGGDTLLLKDGAYGPLTIKANAAFDVPVTIMSQNAKAAQVDRILLAGTTRKLILRNLSVWPSNPDAGEPYLIRSYNTTSDITLDALDIRSEKGAAGYMGWDAAKWGVRKSSGIMMQGPRSVVTGNKLMGVYHGILVSRDSTIVNNVIEGFNGDGMRAFTGGTVRGNRVMNCVKTDTNHDDGFQSFAVGDGAVVADLVIDSNTIIEWTGAPDHPLRCKLQGIGLFDGPFVNLTIVNNLVVVSHYHGITVYGGQGAKITNNTVVHAKGHTLTYPYIAIRANKDEPAPKNVLVSNNISMSVSGKASAADSVVFLNNSVIGTPSLMFKDPAAFDFRPKSSSGFIDSADPVTAAKVDIEGNKRPSGALPDRGAYEVPTGGTLNEASVVPTEGLVDGSVTFTDNTSVRKTGTSTTTTITSPGGSKRIVFVKRNGN